MSELCKDISVSFAAATLLSERDWLILTHQYPDGDTLGSAYALCRALQRTGRKARVICADPIPEKYAYLTSAAQADEVSEAHIVAVDVADSKLLGAEFNAAYGKRIDLCIDHHHSNTRYASRLLLQDCSAAAMPVSKVIAAMGVSLDPVIAEALYTAISTDTGCFKYSNTTAETHRLAAELMELGVCADRINREMFDIKSRARLELERLALAAMQFHFHDRLAIMPITAEMIRRAGVVENDMEGLAPIPRQVEGVWVGIMLRETADGGFKVSFRTGNHADASDIAARLGGGGHAAAAGCHINKPLEETLRLLVDAVAAAVPSITE